VDAAIEIFPGGHEGGFDEGAVHAGVVVVEGGTGVHAEDEIGTLLSGEFKEGLCFGLGIGKEVVVLDVDAVVVGITSGEGCLIKIEGDEFFAGGPANLLAVGPRTGVEVLKDAVIIFAVGELRDGHAGATIGVDDGDDDDAVEVIGGMGDFWPGCSREVGAGFEDG